MLTIPCLATCVRELLQLVATCWYFAAASSLLPACFCQEKRTLDLVTATCTWSVLDEVGTSVKFDPQFGSFCYVLNLLV